MISNLPRKLSASPQLLHFMVLILIVGVMVEMEVGGGTVSDRCCQYVFVSSSSVNSTSCIFPRCILLIVVMSCFCGAHWQLLRSRFCIRSRLWWSRNGRRLGGGDGSKHLRSSGGSTKMEWVGMERIRRKKLRNISPSASNDVHLPALWLESNPSHD